MKRGADQTNFATPNQARPDGREILILYLSVKLDQRLTHEAESLVVRFQGGLGASGGLSFRDTLFIAMHPF